jgi:branched-chain amino acid transport system substrate-binding protein
VSFIDTESKPENGRVAATRALQDGATILMGAIDTAATIGVAQVAEASKVPLVINEASAPQITEQGFTYIFRNFTPATQLVTNAVQRVKDLPRTQTFSPKTAVVMHVNDAFGQAMHKSVTALWEKLGVDIRILDTISYDPRARDISVEVAKAKAAGADILCPISRTNDAVLLVREMVKQDFNPKGIIAPGSPGGYEKEFTSALGKYAEEYSVCLPWMDPSLALTKTVSARYAKEFPNERFVMDDGFGWEGIQIIADAYRRAKSARPADLHAALKATNITEHIMYGGPIAFDAKGQNNNINGGMMQIQNGEPVVVSPSSIAQGRPRFPMTPWQKR